MNSKKRTPMSHFEINGFDFKAENISDSMNIKTIDSPCCTFLRQTSLIWEQNSNWLNVPYPNAYSKI